MIQPEGGRISLKTVLLGLIPFVLVTLALVGAVEFIGVERIQAIIESAGPLAPLVYMGLKIVTYVFAPLSSGPIQMSSGILFGLWPGLIYTLVGEVLGGGISFMIARRWGRGVVARFVGAEGIKRVDVLVDDLGGWRALVYARLFLFSIYDFISYAAGFTTTISLAQYVIVSIVAGFLPTFLSVYVGVSLAEDRSQFLVVYAGLGLLSLIPLAVSFWLRRRRSRSLAPRP